MNPNEKTPTIQSEAVAHLGGLTLRQAMEANAAARALQTPTPANVMRAQLAAGYAAQERDAIPPSHPGAAQMSIPEAVQYSMPPAVPPVIGVRPR